MEITISWFEFKKSSKARKSGPVSQAHPQYALRLFYIVQVPN